MRVQVLRTIEATARESGDPQSVSAAKHVTGHHIALQLLSGRFSGMPVVAADGTVGGVVTELGLLQSAREGKD